MQRLGISQVELAKVAGLDRGALRRALDDSPATTTRTLGKIDRALDSLEHELGIEDDAEGARVTSTITLPTGERITFSGDPAGVAEAATRFLAERRANDGGGI
jgi:transcriptional regulator with XRE-family HTH domain